MIREDAERIKHSILDKITDVIPGSIVNQLWQEYVAEFNPSNRVAPCKSCNSGREWVAIVQKLRDRVTEVLNAEVVTVENQVIVKREKKQKK